MADILNTSVWSETDASNTSSSTQPGWPEGMQANKVNDAARAMQGALKRFADQVNATVATAGSGSAYTVAYPVAPESLYNGQRFLVLAHAACAAAPTLNINSLGAKTIRRMSTTGIAAVAASDININMLLDLVYVAALNQFLWINAPGTPSTGGGGTGPIAITDVTGLTAALAAKADVTALTAATTTEVGSAYSGAGPHTLVAGDVGKMVTVSHTTGVTVNVNSSVFATNARVDIIQIGAGQVTLGGTATRSSSGGKSKLTGQWSGATLWFTSASTYILVGDIAT